MRLLTLVLGLPLPIATFAGTPPKVYDEDYAPLKVLDLKNADKPTIEEAAVQARRLIHSESVASLSTIYQKNAPDGLEGLPIGLPDYYADCSKDGSPALLAISIATAFRNVANGSGISLSVRQHPILGREFFSPVAHHRVALIGSLEKLEAGSDEAKELEKCFLRRHHDAKWWLPGNKIHESYWVKFKVDKVYWIGGFGDTQQIGWIPLDLYKNVTLPDHPKFGKPPGHRRLGHDKPPHGKPARGGKGRRRHGPPGFHHGPLPFIYYPPPPPSFYPPTPLPTYYPPYGYPHYGGYYPPPPSPMCHGPPPPPHGPPRHGTPCGHHGPPHYGPHPPPPHHRKPPHNKPPGDHEDETPRFGDPPSHNGPHWRRPHHSYSEDDEAPEYPGSGEESDGEDEGDEKPEWPQPGAEWYLHWPKPPKIGAPWNGWHPDQQQEL